MKMGSRSSLDDFSDDQLFLHMISTMMYTFGDVKEPLEESVQVVYAILREQMDILLKEAEDVARLRRSSHISHEDILFLLRKNKAKLKHLLHYLEVLDLKPKLLMDVKLSSDDILLPERKKTRVNMCMEFLAHIEDCKEFTSILEDKSVCLPLFAKKRLERRNLMVEKMTQDEYKEFAENLQKSFCPVLAMEFKRWLLRNQATSFSLTPLAVTIIGFLVRELIAEIVEMALEIKSRKSGIQNYLNYPVELSNTAENNAVYKDNCKYLDHTTNVSKKEIDSIISKEQNVIVIKSLNKPEILSLNDKDIDKHKDVSTDVSEKQNIQNCSIYSISDATKTKENSLKVEVANQDVSSHEKSESLIGKLSNLSDSDSNIIIKSTSESVDESSHSQDIVYPNTDSAAIESTQHIDLTPISSITDVTKNDFSLLKRSMTEAVDTTDYNELSKLEDISKNEEETRKITLNFSKTENMEQEPIKPVEIREAYVNFNPPSSLTGFYTHFPACRKKKMYLGNLDWQ